MYQNEKTKNQNNERVRMCYYSLGLMRKEINSDNPNLAKIQRCRLMITEAMMEVEKSLGYH